MDIVAENISDNASVRDFIRRELWKNAELASALGADETEAKDFLMYADYAEPVHRLPPAPHFGTEPRRKQRAVKSKP